MLLDGRPDVVGQRRRPPSRLAVAIACNPATPAPTMNTLAGVSVPAAVINMGNILGSVLGGQQHGVIAGHRGHRRQHVHALRPGDPGHQFEGEQGYPAAAKGSTALGSPSGSHRAMTIWPERNRPASSAPASGLAPAARIRRRTSAAKTSSREAAIRAPFSTYWLSGKPGGDAGAGLDDHLEARLHQGRARRPAPSPRDVRPGTFLWQLRQSWPDAVPSWIGFSERQRLCNYGIPATEVARKLIIMSQARRQKPLYRDSPLCHRWPATGGTSPSPSEGRGTGGFPGIAQIADPRLRVPLPRRRQVAKLHVSLLPAGAFSLVFGLTVGGFAPVPGHRGSRGGEFLRRRNHCELVMMKTYMAKAEEFEQKWLLVDATDKIVGRLASDIAMVLMGKHRPTYTPHVDTGDFVVVVNAEKVVFSGDKWDKKRVHVVHRLHRPAERDGPAPDGKTSRQDPRRSRPPDAAQEQAGREDALQAEDLRRRPSIRIKPKTPSPRNWESSNAARFPSPSGRGLG